MNYRDLIGIPFKTHGRNKEEGFDCYGLAIEILKRNGIILPDVFYDDLKNRESTYNILYNSIESQLLDREQINCIIVIKENNNPVHVGVYIGEGQFIHTTPKTGVIIEPLNRYKPRIQGYYKVIN